LNDTLKGGETLRVNLSNPTGNASLGSLPSAILKIVDSLGTPSTGGGGTVLNSPGVIQLVANNYQVPENGGSFTITVSRTNGSRGVVEVDYTTKDGTAKTSRDYLGVNNKLRWLDGDTTTKSFEVGILDNGVPEPDKTLTVSLSNPTGGAVLGDPAEAVVTILDDDTTTLQFAASTYAVNKDSKSVMVGVTREGGDINQVSVSYDTLDLLATAGRDYTSVHGLLTWVSGDSSPKTFTVPILDNPEKGGNKTFQVKLATITGNATFGKPAEATVMIIDNASGECKPPVIDCFYENKGTLQDIKVTKQGTLSGGTLGGDILNEGVIQDVTLLAKTSISGGLERGLIRGTISSDPAERATLTEVDIAPETTLSNIIIGRRTQLDSSVILKTGVCFEDNTVIPSVDLGEILGRLSTPYLNLNAVRLTEDVLCLPARGGIVGAINGLDELKKWVLTQNPGTGYLELTVENLHYTVLPIQVHQILRQQVAKAMPQGLFINPDGKVTFITHTSREIVALPVVQDPPALQQELKRFGLKPMTMQPNGNLTVPLANGAYYNARPDLFSIEMLDSIPVGLDSAKAEWLSNVVTTFLVFEQSATAVTPNPLPAGPGSGTQRRKQFMYPAAADPEALYALSQDSQTVLKLDGRVCLYMGTGTQKRSYQGLLDYLVTPGTPSEEVKVLIIKDVNGDGLADYQIVYPNGDKQMMYRLPSVKCDQ
jgi:hypothetical protein